jgi:uroporphyrinogen-III synthase
MTFWPLFMVTKASLDGLKVLVTRPQQQAKSLCDSISAAGGEAIAFPVLDIESVSAENETNMAIIDQDMIIFISRNAVSYFMTGLKTPLADNVQLVAVGGGTATAMLQYGLRVDIQAPPPAGSESLLAMPELNRVENKSVLIVRGQGGRELLANTLRTRGAKIRYIEVYRRILPSPSKAEVEQAKLADCIIITSIAGLDNLCQLIEAEALMSKWLIVISERIRQYAKKLGFEQCVVVADASDAALMQQVIRMERNDGKE